MQCIQRILSSPRHRFVENDYLVPDDLQQLASVLKEVSQDVPLGAAFM